MESTIIKQMGEQKLKRKIHEILSNPDFNNNISQILLLPGRQIANYLFSHLYSKEELIKWRAVIAIGEVVSSLAKADMESARVVMRRLM